MRSAITVGQALVTVALLVWLFRGFDWVAFRMLYARLPLSFYLASLAVIVAGIVLYAWRWRTLLAAIGTRIPFSLVLRQYLIGIFMNNFLPSTVGGDATKILMLGRTYGYASVAASVVLDRGLGAGILAVIAAGTLWVVGMDHPSYVAGRVALTALAALFLAAVGVAIVGTGGLSPRLERIGAWPWAVNAAAHLQRTRVAFAGAVRTPQVWLHAIGTVGLYSVLLTAVYQQFFVLQGGVRPDFIPLLVAVASAAVLSNLPVSINGVGLREQLHVLLLAPLGVTREAAVAISLLLFAHLLTASLVGALFWWRDGPGAQRRRVDDHVVVERVGRRLE